ncbi:ABC transporter permease [Demequina aurantiaca]|uniref:ABC transporter permease n=1 Tax=Demequina aurantiaca TaxID=676200 RepID=UPI003D32CF03
MRRVARSFAPYALGLAVIGVVWVLMSQSIPSMPDPLAVGASIATDGGGFFLPHVSATLMEAGWGFLIGMGAALVVAAIIALVPAIEASAMRVALVTFCVPVVAIGPIGIVLIGSSAGGGVSGTAVLLAALSVFYVSTELLVAGLHSVDRNALELAAVYGAPRRFSLVHLRAPNAIPNALSALQIGAPAALLGAILGEYFGGAQGLGVVLLVAGSTGQPERVWAAAALATAVSAILYIALGSSRTVIVRWLYGSAAGSDVAPVGAGVLDTRRRGWRTRTLLSVLASLAIITVLWQVALVAFDVPTYVAKGPVDVARWLTESGNLAEVAANLQVTLVDATLALVAGLGTALALAIIFTLRPGAAQAFVPMSMFMRSVPIVAIVPILVLILGRGWGVVVAIGGLVVLLPALVTLTVALGTANARLTDVADVFGASKSTTLRLIRMPNAVPAFLTALKVSIPAAFTGALLVEWLATGQGLGSSIVTALGAARNSEVWASVAVLVVVTVMLHAVAQVVEAVVLRRRLS